MILVVAKASKSIQIQKSSIGLTYPLSSNLPILALDSEPRRSKRKSIRQRDYIKTIWPLPFYKVIQIEKKGSGERIIALRNWILIAMGK